MPDDEKLSIGELRIYKGNKKGKDKSLFLTNVIIVRDDTTSYDINDGSNYLLYKYEDNNFFGITEESKNHILTRNDIFCVFKRDFDISIDIVDLMLNSNEFFIHRNPYVLNELKKKQNDSNNQVKNIFIREYLKMLENDKLDTLRYDTLIKECNEKSKSLKKL